MFCRATASQSSCRAIVALLRAPDAWLMSSWDISCWVKEVVFASFASVIRRLNCIGRYEGQVRERIGGRYI